MKKHVRNLLYISISALPTILAASSAFAETLVADHTGKIHQFDPSELDAPSEVFAQAIPFINDLAEGPDGFIYATVGNAAIQGSIVRIDPANGIPTGTFWDGSTSGGEQVKRLNGIAFADGVCYVAEADAGRIHAVDAKTGAWIKVAAESPGAVISQISVTERGMLASDFNGQQIIRFPATGDGGFGAPETALNTAPASPWGLIELPDGSLFYSTNQEQILRLGVGEGAPTPWATGESVGQVIYLDLSQDGKSLLAASNASGKVTAWSVDKPETSVWEKSFPAAVGLISVVEPTPNHSALSSQKVLRQAGEAGESPKAGVMVKIDPTSGAITHLGWDTEGGGREINNLFRGPIQFSLRKGETDHPLVVQDVSVSDAVLRANLAETESGKIGKLEINFQNNHLRISAQLDNTDAGGEIQMTFLMNPRMCATSFHASKWTSPDTGDLPGLLIAPDQGTMEVTNVGSAEVRFTGSRPRRETDLAFSSASGLDLNFTPLNLPNPTPGQSDELWQKARRGWWNLPLATSQWGPTDGTDGSIAGLFGNNVISNPVGSTLFWLSDHVLLAPKWSQSVAGTDFLKFTVEYYLANKVLPDGEVAYVNMQSGFMDANPALIIAFWGVVESTGDLEWMNKWLPKLLPVVNFMNSRDVDDDGLIESVKSGNAGTGAFGDTAFDTYSSGHKNAYVNALAHRAYKCLEALSRKGGDEAAAKDYGARAAKLKAAYRDTFYNPETGWIAWWKSEDGELHDVHSDVPTSLATMYGLLELEDAKVMLDKYWTALEGSGFDNFALGVPLNYRPVPANLQFAGWSGSKPDGSETFKSYLNGGAVVSTTAWFLIANYLVGNTERADDILEKMVERQHVGVFPNGGGFQNGVVDLSTFGAEFFDWEGNTTGYEGHLVYSWNFLQAIPLRDPAAREKMLGFLRSDTSSNQ